ncbi:MAG: phospholipase [Chloroflexi bacterium]|nr:phospholipase [Chloroflexota bacterium]
MGEEHSERVHTERAVLDIGGEIGALVIYTDGDRCGDEIELSPRGIGDPQGATQHRFHNQVHERRAGGRSVFAAVYPGVRAGEYDIWQDESIRAGSVTVVGGEVAEVDWRS